MAALRFSVAALEAQHVVQLTFERDFETWTRALGSWTEADVAVRTATISADDEFKIGELESLSMKRTPDRESTSPRSKGKWFANCHVDRASRPDLRCADADAAAVAQLIAAIEEVEHRQPRTELAKGPKVECLHDRPVDVDVARHML